MRVVPGGRVAVFAFSAAGFMATRTLGSSPRVRMSWSEMWTWNADTPASVPAGARISAGKSGNVARSLPSRADVVVKRSPASCIPSPESPANRMTTRSSSWGDFGSVVVSDTMLLRADFAALSRRTRARRCYLWTVLVRMNTPDPGFGATATVYRPTGAPSGVRGTAAGRRARSSGDGDGLVQVDVLDAMDERCTLICGPL